MINTIKWAIYYRCQSDSDRAKEIFNAIYNRLGCTEWGDESQWTEEQEDMFYEQIDLLLPLETEDDIIKMINEVFGKTRVIRDDRHIRPSPKSMEVEGEVQGS
tara:strand:+ start:950 stop:1258 length:309 start_codon:yes stop_codon:yes gene_type:complete